MDNRVYSFNYTDKEKRWQQGFLYDGAHTFDDGLIGWKEYTQLKDKFVSNNLASINSAKRNLAQPIDDYLGMSMMERMRQNVSSDGAWQRIKDIISGQDGTVMSMDIETLGDIEGHVRNPAKYTGITEMGFAFQDFKDGFMTGEARRFTLVDGFDAVQAQSARDVLKAYGAGGWNSLDKNEQWLMRMMSSYGEMDYSKTVRLIDIPELGGKFWALTPEAEKLVGDPTNIENIKRGIDTWEALYKNSMDASRKHVSNIDAGIKYMAGVLTENKMGIVSANSAFEATILGEKLRGFGSSGEALMRNSADVVYASTIIGRTSGMSSFRMQAEALGHGSDPMGPNSVSGLNIASGLDEVEYHHGGIDAYQQILNATGHQFYDGKSFAQLSLEANQTALHKTTRKGQAASRDVITDLNYGDKYFFMQRGSLDKNSIDTVVTTLQDGTQEATQNGSIRGRYYTIDEAGSGWTEFNPMIEGGEFGEGERVYVLKMQDALDDQRAVYKGFRNEFDADKFIERNMIGVDKKYIDKTPHLQREAHLSEIDIGRRKFDSFFNVSDLTANERGEQGGFQELKEYLEMAENTDSKGQFTAEYKARLGLKADATNEQVLYEKGIRSNYQRIKYENAMKRVRSEESALRTMVAEIDDKISANRNAARTAALKDIHDQYIQAIESNQAQYARVIRDAKGSKELFQRSAFTIQDAYSLDVRVGDEVRRINGSTYDNLVSSLDRAYRGATKKEIIASIDELLERTDGSRPLLSKGSTQPFINLKNYLDDIHVPESSYYNTVFSDMAIAMDNTFFKPVRENSEGPFKYFSARNSGGNNTNLRFINNLVGDAVELNEESLYTYAKGTSRTTAVRSVDEMFKLGIGMDESTLKATSQGVIDRINDIKFMAEGGKKAVLTDLTNNLGYSDYQSSIIYDLFGAGDKVKDYSITNDAFKDIQYHIISPAEEGKNAYGVFTTREHANAVEKILLEGNYDTSTRKALEQSFGDNAAIVEFKALHRTKLMDVDAVRTAEGIVKNAQGNPLNVFNGDARVIRGVLGNEIYLTTVSQGAMQEKFALPGIESYIDKNGILSGGFENSGDALIKAYRMRFGAFLDAVKEGRFSSASRLINNALNDTMKPWASPNGRRTLNGQLMSLNDMLHAFQFDGSGLRQTFRNELELSLKHGLSNSPLVKLVEAVGYQSGELTNELTVYNMDAMLNSSVWKEFYAKNLLVTKVNEDQLIKDLLEADNDIFSVMKRDSFNKNILDLMIDQHDVLANYGRGGLVYKYRKQGQDFFPIKEGLLKVKRMEPFLSQLVSPGHYDDIMTLVNSGQIIDAAGMNPSMRPTFNQILNGMYFDPNSLDSSVMNRLAQVDVKVGSSSQSLMEYALLNNVAGLKIQSPTGKPYTEMERQLTAPIKQMSDAELVLKYKELDKDYKAQRGVFADEKYRRAYEIFKAENPSLNEGKILGSSELLNQTPFTSPDVKKIRRYDLQRASDSDDTLRAAFLRHLDANGEMVVREGEEMFQHKYHSYTWDGPDTILTRQNIEDLLDAGETRVLPTGRMVNDVKFMFQQEKSMVHYTFIDDDWLKGANSIFGSVEEARRYQGLIMDLVTGYKQGDAYRPMFIGNLAGFKHGNQIGLDSIYRTIINEYSKVDNGLNTLTGVMSNIEEFKQMDPFVRGDKIILNQRDMPGFENAIRALREALENGEGNKKANRALFGTQGNNGILQKMLRDNVYYLEAQRTNVNEVMAEKVYLDERMAQGVRLRAYDEFRSQSDEWVDGFSIEDRYLKAMKDNALLGNNREVTFVTGKNLSAADELIMGTEKSVNQRAIESWMRTHASQKEVVEGMWASVRQYAGALDPKDVNAYIVNLDDVLDSFDDPKSIGIMDIKEKMFKVEGELPEYLKNANVSGSPKNIYFKFKSPITGGMQKVGKDWVGGKTFEGVLLPLYDIRKLPNGELNFTDSQTAMARFFNVYNKERMNLSHNRKDLTEAFDNMMKGLQEELRMYDKDSFLYKTSGRTMIPNSMQLLAQDEMAPIVEAVWDDKRVAQGVKRERQIYADIAKNGMRDEYIRELDEIDAVRKSVLGDVADKIEKGWQDKKLYQVSDLKMLGIEAKGIENVNGKIMFGNTHAMNARTMRKMGVNTGVIGYQLFKDIEDGAARKLSWYETNDAFNAYLKKGYLEDIENMSKHFAAEGFAADTSITDPGKRLMRQINEYTANNGRYDVDGKKLRLSQGEPDDIIRNNRKKVLEEMDVLGKRYLTDVGLISREVWRPPVFSAQTNARIYLDESVGNGQIRSYTGGLISIQNNLDFDGDMEMTSFILDKRGGMLRLYESGDIMDNELGLAYKSYMASLPANNKIMARLIRDGDAFKVDALGDDWVASAKVVEKFDNDTFIKGIENYMEANGIVGNAQDFADGLSRGQYTKMVHSMEMKKAVQEFSATKPMTTNKDLIRASITARVRKENIGAISTPNYKLRDTLLMIEKAYAAESDRTGQNLVKEIFADLTGIGSDKILDIAEQKAIDVKHIVDAVNVAETSRWATGMNLLFNENADVAKQIATKNRGLKEMMKAVNTSTFKMDDAQLEAVYNEIINGNRETFRKELAAGGSTMADLKLQFRALYDSADLKYARQIQNSVLRSKKTFLSGVADSVMAIQNMVKSIGDQGGSTMDDMLGFARAYTDSRIVANMQTMYIAMPTVANNVEKMGFYQMTNVTSEGSKHHVIFQEVDLKALDVADPDNMKFRYTGNVLETEGTFREINQWLKSNFIRDSKDMGLEGINAYMFVNSPEARNAHITNANRVRITDQISEFLNNIGFDKNANGQTEFDVFDKFTKMGTAAQQRFGQKEYDYLVKVMRNKAEVKEARQLFLDYQYWKANTSQGMNSRGSGQDLIRAVNESIANKYHGPDDPTRYTDEVRAIMASREFGMPTDLLPQIRAERLELGDKFDTDAFRNRIKKLNDDFYDIIPSEKHVNEVFDNIDDAVAKAEHLKRPDAEIQQIRQIGSYRDNAINQVRQAINANNTKALDAFNDDIYGKMLTEQKQLDRLFNWKSPVQETMRVGFGQYTGVEFRQLTSEQVQEVLDSIKTTTAKNDLHQYAINMTGQKLRGFHATATNRARFNGEKVIPDAVDIAQKYMNKLGDVSPQTHSTVVKAIGRQNGMKHKKLADSIGDVFSGVDAGKLVKGGGVVIGAMAAIGIVNNLLHKDSHKSPLSPEFSDDKNDPGFKDGAAHPDVQPRKGRGGGKVYAEPRGGSGKQMQFKVNAKTRATLSDQSNARLIGMAGGGQSNITVNKDTSGVNDNWLANKFAQLSL